jgi:hypothetical protein
LVKPHHSASASPGIFSCPDEPKLDFLSLERRHSIAVDQRDLSPTSRLISGFGRENGSVETPSSSALIIANMTRDLRLPKTLGRDRRE